MMKANKELILIILGIIMMFAGVLPIGFVPLDAPKDVRQTIGIIAELVFVIGFILMMLPLYLEERKSEKEYKKLFN